MATTVLEPASITATVLSNWFDTYTIPVWAAATPMGPFPTADTVATTVCVATSMTETSLLAPFEMNASVDALAPAVPARTATPANHSASRTLPICVPPGSP